MKQKYIYAIPLIGAAICLTACGRKRDDAYDHPATSPKSTVIASDRPNHPNRSEHVVSDVVDDGKDIVSDVVQGGKDIVNDAADAVDDAVGNDRDTDENDNYHADSDGKRDTDR